MRKTLELSLAACAVLLAGCGRTEAAPADDAAGLVRITQAQPFHEAFTRTDSVLLEQPDSAPIVRISGLDRDSAGFLLLGDVSEGNVKLFSPRGRLLRVIGRKGEGPGEFIGPRFPRFGRDGLVYVADDQRPRIQVFTRDGRLVRYVRLRDFGLVLGFEVLGPDSFLLAGERPEARHVLFQVDSTGNVTREHLEIAGVVPTGEADFELWSNIRGFFLDVQGDSAFVASTLSDTVWSVHLPSGRERRVRLQFPGHVPPTRPRALPPDVPALLQWSRSFHRASTLSAGPGMLYLPFVQGILNNADPTVLTVRDARGAWSAWTDPPPIVASSGDTAIGLLAPGEETVALGLFRRRR